MTNPELFAHFSMLKALLETGDLDKVKKVVNEIYYKLGGTDENNESENNK